MKKVFSVSQFTPTKYSTAEDKAKFANHFTRFVESGFKETLFYNWFYQELSNMFAHIAHYSREGFYGVWFSDAHLQNAFIQHTLNNGGYGDPKFTYSDVEKAIKAWITLEGEDLTAQYAAVMEKETREKELAELTRLKAKYPDQS